MKVLICIFSFIFMAHSFADEPNNYAEELKAITQVAELKALQNAQQGSELLPATSPKFSETETINGLLDEVEKLKTKQVVVKRNILNTQTPKKASAVGSNTIYPYIEGKLFEVHTGVDKVTDIALQAGEKLTDSPVAGDTVRWKIAILNSGTEKGEVTHLIIKPLEDNLETNLIVATDRRIYHLKLLSGAWYMPSVSWTYPDDDKKEIEKKLATRKTQESIEVSPEHLTFAYEIKGKKYDWKPMQVFDDGKKTFIKMPQSIKTSEAPALFILNEDDTPMLSNYRVKGDYYIIDRLFERAELRVGEKSSVTIISERYDSGFWFF